jgi:hypothetical protein
MLRRLIAPALLVALALAFFAPLAAHPTRLLYSDYSDALAQHVPHKRFLARAWQETGEIPLWCPHSLGGVPFVHDPQVGVFYPPNLPLLLVPDRYVGAAFGWLLVLQVIAAGLSAYAYARGEGLGEAGAFVTGAGYMLSGKWLLHLLAAGHTVAAGLAWLPLVALCFERALRRRSPGWAAAAGAPLALVAMGTHPQWTVYAALFLVAWTAGPALEGAAGWRGVAAGLARWAGLGALTATAAVALGAVQLLPTLEAMGLSCRYLMRMASVDGNGSGLEAALPAWRALVGPSLRPHPDWENAAGLGVAWLMAAAAGAVLGGRRVWPRTAACLGVFTFALTGGLAAHELPGLGLLRGPSRMLLLGCLPVALLAGIATDRLPAAVASAAGRRRLLIALAAVGAAAVVYTEARLWQVPAGERHFHPYWPALALTVPPLFWAAAVPAGGLRRGRALLWCGALVADLVALSWPFVHVHSAEHVYPPSPAQEFLAARRGDRGRVLDVYCSDLLSPLGTGAPVAVNLGLYPVRGYNPLDYFRYKNYLRMITGTTCPGAPFEIVDGFPLTHRPLVDLLGVRYLLQPADLPPEGGGWRVAFRDPNQVASFNYPFQGMHVLPAYTVYENDQALPRAFVAPRAAPLPAGGEREALWAADFRETVLVEGCDPAAFPSGPGGGFREGRIVDYRPNRVAVEVDGTAPGWLVLTDPWYPGWTCTVDGEERAVYPGDYLFRTVPVPAGRHEVVFRFRPASYLAGRWVTLGALAGLGGWWVLTLARRLRADRVRRPLSAAVVRRAGRRGAARVLIPGAAEAVRLVSPLPRLGGQGPGVRGPTPAATPGSEDSTRGFTPQTDSHARPRSRAPGAAQRNPGCRRREPERPVPEDEYRELPDE